MRVLGALTLALATGVGAGHAEDWPQWRGPNGDGVSKDKGFPTRWSADSVAWKARLGGLGISSPIVWGDRVFVTSQSGRSRLKPGNHPTLARGDEAKAEKPLGADSAAAEGGTEKIEFLVEAYARKDGKRLWQYRLAAEGELPEVHQKHNLASSSPVTDGRRVYAWFGNGQLVAMRPDGTLAWQRHMGRDYAPFQVNWGHGSSPTLHGGLLILLCDHDTGSYLVALDAASGRERWKADRPKGSVSYTTPSVVRGPSGPEMIVNSTTRIDAYDPRSGALLWWTGESHRFAIPVPAYHDGTLYMSRGYRSGPYLAVRTGGKGDVSKTHVSWSVATGAPYVSSLLYYQGVVYMANDVGVVTTIDPASGEKIWQERIDGIFTASPIAAEGRVYLVSETGDTIVLQAGRVPKLLGRNSIGERSVATPAVSRGQIFIRTDDHLVGVGPGR